MKLREEAADFTSTMALKGMLTGLLIMITYACIGATVKDGEGKLDVCGGGKYVYVGVWTFAIFVYGFLLLGLVLPYFGLPLWLTCGYEVGGFMPTALEELEEVYGKEVPFAVGIYHAVRHMGTCLRHGRDFRKVAVTSLIGLVALVVGLLPGILAFFMPQLLRSKLELDCWIDRVTLPWMWAYIAFNYTIRCGQMGIVYPGDYAPLMLDQIS
ncbi:hypothetical protein LTR78_007708 [Recurvomyces mirabilis]|uniref:Uncharacterized protein n=1 Tax=Recurvomyces mirabilis TaxID=574656 RepID=A0AAE0TRB8_9PEZI|nr:hypothetical protein LTR78_007708 [Recurvomyces mirabilis]KAK5151595.1 hypothetical protein LTS14_009082 [Recurvomyces mirabilis]